MFAYSENGRAPSIFCVEKHVGSAQILHSEYMCGHLKHRILVVGNLNEAIEECGDWPELKTILLETRRQYQYYMKIPNWELIASMISKEIDLVINKEQK